MSNIIVYGADWCRDCVLVKEFLDEQNIPYDFLDITDPKNGKAYSEKVIDINKGKRIIPTLDIDGVYYSNPRPAELSNIIDNLNLDRDEVKTYCSLGKELYDGDTVLLTRDLDVKGSSLNLKQGTALNNIKISQDPAYIDCKVGKAKLAIKTMYVKKKS